MEEGCLGQATNLLYQDADLIQNRGAYYGIWAYSVGVTQL